MFKKLKPLRFGAILAISILLTLGFSISLQSLLAVWTAPISTPPSNNILDLIVGGKLGVVGNTLVMGNLIASNTKMALFADTTSGNVGIGTMSPGAKLDVVGLIRNSAPSQGTLELSGLLPGYADNTYPTIKTSGAYLYLSTSGKYTGYIGNSGIIGLFNTSMANNVQINASGISWLNGGNVGIGTTNPLANLQVVGNTRTDRLSFGTSDTAGIANDYYSIHRETGAWSYPYPDLVIQYHTGIKYDAHQSYGGHRFYTGYDGTGNPAGLKMQITDKVYVNDVCTTPGGKCLSASGGASINYSTCVIYYFSNPTFQMCPTNYVVTGVDTGLRFPGVYAASRIRCCKIQ